MTVIYQILETVLPFSWLDYNFMKNAFVAILLITPLLGVLGTMAVNNKMAFFSDALGHSALTGVALGVLLGIQNDLISMIAFGVLLALVITRVKSAKTASADTVISVFSSTAIALGLVILSAGGGVFQIFAIPDRRYPEHYAAGNFASGNYAGNCYSNLGDHL